MDNIHVTKDVANKTLIIERVFDAPRERVWDAYANADRFVAWWGPEGWETTVKAFDFAPGGRIHYCMTCVDKNQGEWYGQESWGLMAIEAIDAPNSFTYKDYFSNLDGTIDETKPGTTGIVELHDEDGKTRLVSRSVTESPAQLEELLAMGVVEGFSSSLDRLGRLLAA